MKTPTLAVCLVLEITSALAFGEPRPDAPGDPKDIKARCLDFNWAASTRRCEPKGFSAPGTWVDAVRAAHVAWYKAMGANVIQAFCVSTNGHAHPHVVSSDMCKEADWLMNESGDKRGIDAVRKMVGPHTRLISCLARWNGQDATMEVPEALAAGIGLYGFAFPREEILSRPVSELKGDDRNIAVLARAFHRASIKSLRNAAGEFQQPRCSQPNPKLGIRFPLHSPTAVNPLEIAGRAKNLTTGYSEFAKETTHTAVSSPIGRIVYASKAFDLKSV